ncbi:MarR family winged helix-turn-helix transcriptional regulator [Klebsiella sp. B345]|uniref:MarR family winged helix-turn-helix transcriptional regulator n=1 Tax=Klebsiella TaxID=570 RepID=UPI000B6C1284|nr:MarR family transcriptional regulator [Klebsiella pneumoniae]
MLVEQNNTSEHPDSHESRFHKEEFPFFWVVNVYAKYTQLMEIELKKIDIDLSRFRVLMLVHQYHRASISRITEYAVSKMPTVTKIVGRLRDDGLLTTHISASDGRVTEAELTPAGQAKVAEAQILSKKVFARAFKGITPAQEKKMNHVLSLLLHNLND